MEKFFVDQNQFNLEIDGITAYITFEIEDGVYHLPHTIVPKELGGRGVGSKLAKLTFEHIKNQGLKLKPICPFLIAFVKKNPEYSDLLVE